MRPLAILALPCLLACATAPAPVVERAALRQPSASREDPSEKKPLPHVVHFETVVESVDEYGGQHTRVSVVVAAGASRREERVLVTVIGSCADGGEPLKHGELTHLSCWFAGQGDDFVVERRESALLVLRRELDEETDIPDWSTLATIPLADALVVSADAAVTKETHERTP